MGMNETEGPAPIAPELLLGLKNGAKRLYIDATYSGRGHLESCARWQRWNTWLGVPATVASSILAAGAAVSALVEGTPLVTALLAGAAAVLNGLRSFLQPDAKAQAHGVKGNQYLAIRNDARTFLEVDLHAGLPQEELVSASKELRRRYNELKQTDPQLIPRGDYEAAKRNVEVGESSYTNDPLWQELGD
jgi:hypothetical protein